MSCVVELTWFDADFYHALTRNSYFSHDCVRLWCEHVKQLVKSRASGTWRVCNFNTFTFFKARQFCRREIRTRTCALKLFLLLTARCSSRWKSLSFLHWQHGRIIRWVALYPRCAQGANISISRELLETVSSKDWIFCFSAATVYEVPSDVLSSSYDTLPPDCEFIRGNCVCRLEYVSKHHSDCKLWISVFK